MAQVAKQQAAIRLIFNDKVMAIGYREMAEINLQLSEVCFAAESEVDYKSYSKKKVKF